MCITVAIKQYLENAQATEQDCHADPAVSFRPVTARDRAEKANPDLREWVGPDACW